MAGSGRGSGSSGGEPWQPVGLRKKGRGRWGAPRDDDQGIVSALRALLMPPPRPAQTRHASGPPQPGRPPVDGWECQGSQQCIRCKGLVGKPQDPSDADRRDPRPAAGPPPGPKPERTPAPWATAPGGRAPANPTEAHPDDADAKLREELRSAKTTLAAATKWGNPAVTAAAEAEVASLTRRLEAKRPVNARFQSALDRAATAKKRLDDAIANATALREQLDEALEEVEAAEKAVAAREAEVKAMKDELAASPAGAPGPKPPSLDEPVKAALDAATALLQALATIGADTLPPDARLRAESAFDKLAKAHTAAAPAGDGTPADEADADMKGPAEPAGGPKRPRRTPEPQGPSRGGARRRSPLRPRPAEAWPSLEVHVN